MTPRRALVCQITEPARDLVRDLAREARVPQQDVLDLILRHASPELREALRSTVARGKAADVAAWAAALEARAES